MMFVGMSLVVVTSLVSAWLTSRLARAPHFGPIDLPNDRTLHSAPTPRTGGLAVLAALAGGALVAGVLGWLARPPWWEESVRVSVVFAGAALVAAHAYWNDLNETAVLARLGVQTGAAIVTVLAAGLTLDRTGVPLGPLAVPITVLGLVWMMNLYNFMDGMDGFAAGMTVVGFTALAGFAFRGGQSALAWASLLVVAATAGFLIHNFPPARIFLGDAGSVSLGFLAGSLSLLGVGEGVFDPWVPILIFSPFIVDATTTLGWRLLRGERVWRPHREHYYQRLVLAGWGHRNAVLAEYILMLASGVSAAIYVCANVAIQVCLLSLWAIIYCSCMCFVRALEIRRPKWPCA
jgi:UDP-N-acetylmuramyl pentapeptide phosphotransferase/UDP-N-acetylglucosamine-1-phosphate transferase